MEYQACVIQEAKYGVWIEVESLVLRMWRLGDVKPKEKHATKKEVTKVYISQLRRRKKVKVVEVDKIKVK